MAMKAVVARNISEEMKEKMEELGYELTVFTKEMQEKGEVPDAEVAVGSQALKHMPWEKMTDLRAVFLKSVGIDYLPLDLLKERGIVLFCAFGRMTGSFCANKTRRSGSRTFPLEALRRSASSSWAPAPSAKRRRRCSRLFVVTASG